MPGMDLMDRVGIHGHVIVEHHAPDGLLLARLVVPNLITDVGDEYYGERAAGIAGPPDQVTGMRLGTGSTAPAKFGAGAAMDTYLAGTSKPIVGGYPTSTQPGGAGTARWIAWQAAWAAGEADGAVLREAVLTNETPLTDVAGVAGNTLARALFGPITLGALDTLTLTWVHALLGA